MKLRYVGIPKNPEARKLWFAEKKQKQEDAEERLYVRWLIFEKGNGQVKHLSKKEKFFINRHIHKAHDRYLMALQQGIDTRINKARVIGDPAHPFSYLTYRKRWYGNAKGNYRMHDVAKVMKIRWEQLHAGNTEVRQLREGEWMSQLRHAIDKRDGRSVGVPVPDLQAVASSVERRSAGPKQVRERRPKKTGADRDSKTLGKKETVLLNA